MTPWCGEIVTPLLRAPRVLGWQHLPKFNCYYAEWGVMMNDGRAETYISIFPKSAIQCIKEKA